TVVLAICSKPLPRATDVAPDLPPALDAFFDRAFQRDRDRRFQTALELSDALVAALHGDAARPAPPGGLDGFEGGGDATLVVGAATRVVDLRAAAARSTGAEAPAAPGEPDGEATRAIVVTPLPPPPDDATL